MRKYRDWKPSDRLDELDVFAVLRAFRKYWRGYALAGVVAALAAYGYFQKTLPPPESLLRLELGFKGIETGHYPNGSIFNKTDIISQENIGAANQKLHNGSASSGWPQEQFGNFFSVEGIYPLELEALKNQLADKKVKLRPEEISVMSAKLLKYTPSQYVVTFSPSPAMPQRLRNDVLENVVKGYVEKVNQTRQRIQMGSPVQEVIDTSVSPVAVLDYLGQKTDRLEKSIMGDNSTTKAAGATTREIGNGGDADKNQGTHPLAENLSFRSTLYNIKAELAMLDSMIFDQGAISDVTALKKSLEVQISELTLRASKLEKQSAFRLMLARIPGSAAPVKNNLDGIAFGNLKEGSPADTAASADAKGPSSVMAMLLSFSNQYYALMDEVKGLADEQALAQKEVDLAKNRRARLERAVAVPAKVDEALRQTIEKEKHINQMIDQLSSQVSAQEMEMQQNSRPVVSSYFIAHRVHSVQTLYVVGIGVGVFFAVTVIHLFYAIFLEPASKSQEEGAVETPFNKIGSKISGKN